MSQIGLVLSIFGAAAMLMIAILGTMILVGYGSFALIRNRMHLSIPLIFCAVVAMGMFIANAITGKLF